MNLSSLKQNLALLLMLSSFIGLLGCVGAIKEEEAEVPIDDASLIGDPTFTFEGITAAEAIGDARINLTFPPAQLINGATNAGGAAPEGATVVLFTYKVTRDGSEDAVANFVDSNLSVNGEGNYVVSVETNGRGDCGTYNVTAIKTETLEARSGVNFFRVCSSDEFYPVFDGVLNMTSLSGCDLYTGATINWRIAEKSPELQSEITRYNNLITENLTKYSQGEIDFATYTANNNSYNASLVTLEEYSPDSYLVYYDTTEEAVMTKLSNPAQAPDATVTNVNTTSLEINGLTTGNTYFFAVRSATSLITATSKKNVEGNVVIASYDVPQVQSINFSGITSVDIPQNADGYNSATIRYTACVGCDSYQYYAVDSAKTFIDLENDTPTATFDLNSNPTHPESFTLTGLGKHNNYNFFVVGLNACGAAGAPENAGTTSYLTEATTPPIAPFNGIANVNSVGGTLDRLEIDWELPDTTAGVYDQYKIYLTDSSGNIISTLSNAPHATDPYIEPVDDIADPSISSITIMNVEAGADSSNPNNYCFIVAPKESDMNGPGGVGREMEVASRVTVCKAFYYQAPTFAGPNSGSCNATSSSFEVSYPVPTDGTYQQFRLYYKKVGIPAETTFVEADYIAAEADTSTVIQGKGEGLTYTRIEFDYDPLNTPTVTTPIFAQPAIANPFTITGLDPDTTYIFAMETYFDQDGAGAAPSFYVRPEVLRSCKTRKPDVTHEGWDHIMALGIKTNGLDGDSVIKERLSTATQASLTTLSSGLASDTEKLASWHMEEDATIVENTQGHVFISWFDFKFADLGTYANELVDGSSTIRYYIKRSVNADMSGAIDRGHIDVVNGVFLYHFYDNNIPIHSKRYYYQAELRIDGVALEFASTNQDDIDINNANAILEVIVPPPNMSFIHRYMFNKHQCTRISKDIFHGKHVWDDIYVTSGGNGHIDFSVTTGYEKRGARGSMYNSATNKNYNIKENYRCLYNGVGSTYDESEDEYYFDIGKSFLVDRFETGVKIGLTDGGDPEAGCLGDGNGPYNCISRNFNFRGSARKNTIWYELGDMTNEYYLNDDNNNGRLNREDSNDIWINTSVGGVATNTWDKVDYLSLSNFSDRSDSIFSNSAYLPPARLFDTDKMKVYCGNKTVTIDSDDYTNGRLGSRQEFIVFGGWHEQIAPLDIKQISQRVNYTGDKVFYGCNTEEKEIDDDGNMSIGDMTKTGVPYGHSATGTPPNLNDNNYPSQQNDFGSTQVQKNRYFPHLLRTGSYSDNSAKHSSHLCFSKFGLQDYVGNELEVTDDWFIRAGDGKWKLDLTKTPDEIEKYWMHSTTVRAQTLASAPAPYFPTQDDFYNEYNMNIRGGTSNAYFQLDDYVRFYNPLAGLQFGCNENSWGYDPANSGWRCYYNSGGTNWFPTKLMEQTDSSNYLFSSMIDDNNNFTAVRPGPTDTLNALPSSLREVASNLNYLPHWYSYLRTRIRFPDQTTAYPLTVGGAGYSTRREQNKWQNSFRTHSTNPNYNTTFGTGTVYMTGSAYKTEDRRLDRWSDTDKFGWRCVYSID